MLQFYYFFQEVLQQKGDNKNVMTYREEMWMHPYLYRQHKTRKLKPELKNVQSLTLRLCHRKHVLTQQWVPACKWRQEGTTLFSKMLNEGQKHLWKNIQYCSLNIDMLWIAAVFVAKRWLASRQNKCQSSFNFSVSAVKNVTLWCLSLQCSPASAAQQLHTYIFPYISG